MPINFAAITPHPPLLIPSIGKENLDRLKDTQNAFKKLSEELVKARINTILIISPHGQILEDTFSINQRPHYTANFEEFGDFAAQPTWPGNLGLAQEIKAKLETKNILQLYSEENIDYGAAVPLFLLTADMPDIKIIPLSYSELDNQHHFDFGRLIQPILDSAQERVAIIASGDLSHRLSKNAPAGFSARSAKFDNKLIELLSNKKTQDILNLSEDLIEEVAECGLKSILILLGILDNKKYSPQVLSYESPFGVGYLNMNFKIK